MSSLKRSDEGAVPKLTGGIYVNRKAVSHCPARNARDKGSYPGLCRQCNDSVIASGTPVANVNIVGTGVGEISTGE